MKGRVEMVGGKGSGKVNSHPAGRDNSRLGLSAFVPKLSWLRRQHRWDGVAFASLVTSRGLQELFSSCQAAWLQRRLARSCLPHALIARAAGLEPTSPLSRMAPSVNDEKGKSWEILSLSLAPDSLPYIIQ